MAARHVIPAEKIKLRLHYQGRFQKVPGTDAPTFQYAGGEVFNESIEASCQYVDLCRKLNEKFGDTVSFRYQTPGEDLDPETLVMVTDNDDLQELYEEYFQALARPSAPHKTFRIKLFVFAALQFETDYSCSPATMGGVSFTAFERDWMDASMAAAANEDVGPHFDSWCTDCEELPSTGEDSPLAPSQPSSDTAGPAQMMGRSWLDLAQSPAADECDAWQGGRQACSSAVEFGVPLCMRACGLGAAALPYSAGRRISAPAFSQPSGVPATGWDRQGGLHLSQLPASLAAHWHVPARPGVVAAPADAVAWGVGLGSGAAQDWQQQWGYDMSEGSRSWQGAVHQDNAFAGWGADAANDECGSAAPCEVDSPGALVPLADGAVRLVRRDGRPMCAALSACTLPQEPLTWNALPAHQLSGMAFTDIGQSAGAVDGAVSRARRGAESCATEEFTEADFDFDDPYVESLSGGCSARGGTGGSMRCSIGATTGMAASCSPCMAASRGDNCTPATWAVELPNQQGLSALPSHISAFGDSVCSVGWHLPSHISAFGDAQTDALRSSGQWHGNSGGTPLMESAVGRAQAIHAAGAAAALNLRPAPAVDTLIADAVAPPSSTPKQLLLAQVASVRRPQVQHVRNISEGAFGEVSEAHVFPYGTVAIKWLKKERFAKYRESFQQEAEVLSQLNHPNIIRMYGLVTEPDPSGQAEDIIAGIMTEYVRGGSLAQHLRHLKRRLTLRERAHVACQAVLGMAYLHDQQPAIIHFDLKPDNLLVDGQGDAMVVKVADFGLSKHKFNSYVSCRDLRGTLPYMAPELVANPNQVSEKCDVWSMGVVMWEMVALQVPFQDLSAQQILVGLMHGSLHLSVPQDCEPAWQHLIELCVEPDPACRPSFRQLAAHLEVILDEQHAEDSGIVSVYD